MKNTKLASKGTAIGMGILILMNMFGMKTFIYRFLDTHPSFRTYFLTTILTFGLFAMLYQLIGALKRSDLVIHQDKILSK